MKTVIFILALTAIAAPVFTGAGDAITCTVTTNNCNMCIADAAGATAACFDCKAGYALGTIGAATGVCTRCAAGMGIAAGVATNGALANTRPSAGTCTACDTSCAECLLPSAVASCTKCAIGKWASAFASGTATCGTACAAGKTRDVAAADLTAVETEAVCVVCNGACAECMGTAATKCTKCAAGYFLSAKVAAGDLFGSCAWCTGGMGKDADTTAVTATTAATTSAAACTTKCTGTDCGACSTAKPAECLACASTFTFDATAKTCKAASSGTGSSATLIQALCGATVAAYALF
jgi:hypothetical protein